MAGFGNKFKNLWSVPEELEDEDRSSRRSRDRDYKKDRRSRDDDYSDSSYYSRYSSDSDDYSEESYSGSSYDTYTNYSDDEYYDDTSAGYSTGLSASSYYSNNLINTNKILNINATARLQVVFFKPVSFNNDAVQIADELVKSHTVLLNFEDTPRDESKRIVDFLSGCAYVSGGKVQRIAKNIFIITPNNVELTGDSLIDELQSNGLQITE
ncbi:MAG: cell division protein SepF [Acutalibacteraceae bacterium]|nr:cell division protein SepF [Acutalibacteraceae bacterium]